MRFKSEDSPGLIETLDDMAATYAYEKILAKIPATEWDVFKNAGYTKEAVVPELFNGGTDGFFVAKYFSAGRQKPENIRHPPKLACKNKKRASARSHRTGPAARDIVRCKPWDAEPMSAVYRQVFESYPFPIHEPAYLKRLMKEGALYYCIRIKGHIAAIAAAELDSAGKNVEMTDFATLPEWRGMGFAGMLLRHMEQEAGRLGIKTAYTIARAASCGMNSVFKNNGYGYAGCLVNNSQIAGSIQSMAVWFKHL